MHKNTFLALINRLPPFSLCMFQRFPPKWIRTIDRNNVTSAWEAAVAVAEDEAPRLFVGQQAASALFK